MGSSVYPGGLDDFAANTPTPALTAMGAVDSTGRTHSRRHDDVEAAMEAVEGELGTNPSGGYSTVGGWLAALEARLDVLEEQVEPPPDTGFYGPGLGMDSLANIQVGPSGVQCSMRFRAAHTTTLPNFRVYWLNQDYPGYGGGTGGTIRCTIQTDSGGVPSGTVLATLDVVHPASDFPLKTFSSPPTLTAGTLYHLVFTNIDGSPNTNFVSIDHIWTRNATIPRQPTIPDTDWAVLEKIGSGAWAVAGNYTPIVDFTYGNGAHQGIGYMENEDTALSITGSNYMVRERLVVSGGDRVVTGAGVRVARASGSGPLTVRLENSAGTLIDSFTIPAASIPTQSQSAGSQSGVWVAGVFSAARTLTNGATYYLRLSTDASTSYWVRGIQEGSSYGFDPATYFDDGLLQRTTNGSTWNTVSGLDTEGDMQAYLTTA